MVERVLLESFHPEDGSITMRYLHDPLALSPSSGLDSPSHHSRKRFVHEKLQPTSDKDIQSRIQTASDITRKTRTRGSRATIDAPEGNPPAYRG